MKFFAFLAGAAVFALVLPAHAESSLNISGIRLGTTPEQARAAAAAVNPKYVFSDLRRAGEEKIAGFEAKEDPRKVFSPDLLKVIFDERNATWFVYREQRYETGSRPTKEATLAALKEKYGEPSFTDVDVLRGLASWQFDRAGKIYKGARGQAPCPGTRNRGSTPEKFGERCGSFVQAQWNFMNPEKLVEQLQVTIVETQHVYDALKQQQDAADSAKKNALDAERAKAVKPKL